MTKSQQQEENGPRTEGAELQGPVGFVLTLKTVCFPVTVSSS